MSGALGPMKLDFSSFYKFVASVGLILLAASVVLPWFVLRTAAPDAPSGTPAAAVVDLALDERADQYRFILQVYPWMSLGLFVLGCGLTAYGLIAWRDRQKKQDADEDEVYRQRRELGQTTQASDDDRDNKLDREALEDNGPSDIITPDSRTSAPSGPPSSQSGETGNPSEDRYRARREFIKEAEAHVGDLLSDAFADTHRVEAGVRIGADAPILDLVARAGDPSRWSSFAMEVRLVASSGLSSMRLRDSMLSVAIAARDVPEGQIQLQRVGRPPVAKSVSLCFVIVDDELAPGELVSRPALLGFGDFAQRAQRVVRTVNSVLARKVGVIIVPRSQFKDISAHWVRQSVLELMQHPEDPAFVSMAKASL